MNTSNDKGFFTLIDSQGRLQSVHVGDLLSNISGVPYTQLYVMELEPLAHDPILAPSLHHYADVEITPLQRSAALQDLRWDEDFNAPVAQSGVHTQQKKAPPFTFEGQVHWSRAGRVMMGPGGDNKDSLGWITVENPDESQGHSLYRVHFNNRARS